MGCNCKKTPRQEPRVITSTTDCEFCDGSATVVPQTPEELHIYEMNEYAKRLSEEHINKLQQEDIDTTEQMND